MKFSERYGYTKPSDVIIRETITHEIQNAICTCFDKLEYRVGSLYEDMEEYLWVYFLNQRLSEFRIDYNQRYIVATSYIENQKIQWYQKIDLIEASIKFLLLKSKQNAEFFMNTLNTEFQRLNFGYRIIEGQVAEVTSSIEIQAIEDALKDSNNQVRLHLKTALELYAKRPVGEYRGSIKESISAVEVMCREKTGKSSLGDALNEIKKKKINIPDILRDAFLKLYVYTNDADTGIRHGLMDDTATYTPCAEEALFMLVSCSAFVNYLNKKWK